MNGVDFKCRSLDWNWTSNPGYHGGDYGEWDEWGSGEYTHYFLYSVDLRSESDQGGGDDTAANQTDSIYRKTLWENYFMTEEYSYHPCDFRESSDCNVWWGGRSPKA